MLDMLLLIAAIGIIGFIVGDYHGYKRFAERLIDGIDRDRRQIAEQRGLMTKEEYLREEFNAKD